MSLGFTMDNKCFSPLKSSQPAVTFHPALCGSEPPAHPRCLAEKKKKAEFHWSANLRAVELINKSTGEGETQQKRSTVKKLTLRKLNCVSINQPAADVETDDSN